MTPMGQHFLLSRTAKTLSLAQVFRMTDGEAETTFKNLRWADTDGAPVCPFCGSLDAYEARRPNGALRFRCKGCKKDFTVTSGTLFASHKLPPKPSGTPQGVRISASKIIDFCQIFKLWNNLLKCY
jgi:transposase-like protein